MRSAELPYTIRLAEIAQVAKLPRIEIAAAALFPEADLPPAHRTEETPACVFETAAREGRLWVALDASGEPVGFALVELASGGAHLAEMDVLPAHGRRGVGTALVRTVMAWVAQRGLAALTLTTFRHLPWNGPFYRRLGFEELASEQITPALRARLAGEAQEGLDPAQRIAMRWAPESGAAGAAHGR
ncbi:MAG: GNAT family N-acetyltransferase [Myxococcales bacterium]|nr:GNAT family N-acetyltransferase [Myxococcales bacterium]